MATRSDNFLDPVAPIRAQLDTELQQAARKLRAKRVDVHGARKQLKRARALARLLRDALGSAAYQRVNTALRDVGRQLSEARNAEVLLATTKDLSSRRGGRELQITSLRRALAADRANHLARTVSRAAVMAAKIERVQRSLARIRILQSGWAPIGSALKRTYRRGRKARVVAQNGPGAECLHEWRKQVKYHWHQLQALQSLAPKPIEKMAKQLHGLSDLLGDDHDLFVLRTRIAESNNDLDEDSRIKLRQVVDKRRMQLQRKAFGVGTRPYRQSPKQLEQQLQHYWRKRVG